MPENRISILLLILVMVLQACSVSRRVSVAEASDKEEVSLENYEKICRKENLSQKDFMVNRIKIDYSTDSEERSLSGFLKHSSKGDMLLSLRSVAGIEVARVMLCSDSIKIYDKLNYILYLQDTKYLERKYAIPVEAIDLLWGDCPGIFDRSDEAMEEEDVFKVEKLQGDIKYKLAYHKEYARLVNADIYHEDGRELHIRHSYDQLAGTKVFPSKSVVEDGSGRFKMVINYSGLRLEKVKNMRFSTLNKKDIKILR